MSIEELGIEMVEKTVFISYRRTNIPWALAIYENLTNHGFDVFFDYEGIRSGDFERAILENIKERAHFIVLLTPSALEGCREPGDWVRREIETALDIGRNIVPLMLEGFDFTSPGIADQLNGRLALLKHYNALTVPAAYFSEAMDRLRNKFLNVELHSVSHPASEFARNVAVRQKLEAKKAPTVGEKELTAQQWFEHGTEAADLDEKIKLYSQAIALKPDFPDALNNRGIARKARGDTRGALLDYDEAIRQKADFADAFNNRANARQASGDIQGSLLDYSEAIRIKPDYPLAFNNRAIARRALGDMRGALLDCEEALRLKPDFAEAFNNRGITRKTNGDFKGALSDYDKAISLRPDYAEPVSNRANVRCAIGDIQGALADYDEAIRVQPDFVDAFKNRAIAREANGDPNGAASDRAEALRLSYRPKDPRV